MASQTEVKQRLVECLRELHLPTFRDGFEDLARRAVQESLSYEQYLGELAEQECQARRTNRIERWLRGSDLPIDKSLACFDMKRLPAKVARQAPCCWTACSSTLERTFWLSGVREAGRLTCYAQLRRNWCVRVARYSSVLAACWCKIC